MKSNLSMFKTYDIRSKAEGLTPEVMHDLAKAIARYYKDDVKVTSLVLAKDARLHSSKLMDEFVRTFPEYGLNLYINLGQISSCQFYYMCMKMRASGGIMITASHNPASYTGCKLIGPDVSPIASECGPEGGILKIRDYYNEDNEIPHCTKGKVHIINLLDDYVDYTLKLAGIEENSLSGLKVFAEFLSGTGGTEFLMAFNKAGAEVEAANIVPDGSFPNGDPNPLIESSISPAREKMREGSYDIGYCFDGDADRMDLMYPDGSQIIPGLNMAVILPYIKSVFHKLYGEKAKCRCFVDVKAMPISLMEIAKHGIKPYIIRNGHSFIKGKLKEYSQKGYFAAEEESAHYYMNFPYNPEIPEEGVAATENSLFFALLSAKAMKERESEYKRMHQIQKSIFREREWSLGYRKTETMPILLKEIEGALLKEGAYIINTMDDDTDLDASLFRFNLPRVFSTESSAPKKWWQVTQRISRSEDGITRWEVAGSSQDIVDKITNIIRRISGCYVEKKEAYFI